eukprot:TRINITY_DN13599_c0_g1_i3.p1 TRINITY_DN13599_c0_g1~~TRINITY_DN13599_c0_g1_i3.p1  ORF type:complete len:454 (-),score=112.17 TRINITY_DN13599_c0_g1_i3:148-1467(-)
MTQYLDPSSSSNVFIGQNDVPLEGEEDESVSPIQLVLQFLHERGYTRALEEMEREAGETFAEGNLKMGSMLMSIIADYEDSKNATRFAQMNLSKMNVDNFGKQGNGIYPGRFMSSLKSIHSHNVLAVRCCPAPVSFSSPLPLGSIIASASTDKTIKISNFETEEVLCTLKPADAPVLALDFNPVHPHLLLGGAMDSSHFVFDISKNGGEGLLVAKFKQHNKYVVRAKWHPDGVRFATGSYDRSACIYRQTAEHPPAYELVRTFTYEGTVEGLAFTPDGDSLIVSVRGDNYLHYIDMNTYEEDKANMNQNGDDHVSFTALDLCVFPSGQYVLVCTDSSRLIMLRVKEAGVKAPDCAEHVRTFYGCSNDEYSQPRCQVSLSGQYVFATSQDNAVYVWDVATQKVVEKLAGHTAIVRDINYHPQRDILASCSFDKTIRLHGV